MIGIVFRKTRAGVAAIGDRVGSLPRALRSLLIVVNGETPTETLIQQARSLHLDETALQDLLERGLIEPSTGVIAEGTDTRSFTLPTADDALPDSMRSLTLARAYAAAYMRDFAGDDSDAFSALFTNVESEAELLALLENCAQVIADVESIESAARFTRRTRALLPAAVN